MNDAPDQAITQLLNHYQNGDQEAFDELFEMVYSKLHTIAHAKRRHWNGSDTLNTTALIHETYLKLVDQSNVDWQNRTHFFAVASKVMRHILINYARDKNRKKRGGDQKRVSFEKLKLTANGVIEISDSRAEALVILDETIKRLKMVNPTQEKIVECLFFGGMTIKETAAALNVSPSTIKRGWKTAQLWLYREMHRELASK